MTVDDIAVKGELQLGCDVPCGDDGQARGLAPMHHAVAKDRWRLGVEGPEESGRFTWCTIRARVHGEREVDENGVSQVREEGDSEFE